MPDETPTGQREHMSFAQADALHLSHQRLMAGQISISEYLAEGVKAWKRGVTPYPLYVRPDWEPPEVREKAKAAGI